MLRRVVTLVLVSVPLLLALPVGPAGARLPRRPFPRECRATAVRVDDASVPAEFCRNARSGREPALVVLHGCGGFGGVDRRLAEQFPLEGIATIDLDYFALTPPPGDRGFCTLTTVPGRVLATWREIVLAARADLGSRPGIDRSRIGVAGWSLGADIALSTAAASPGTFATAVAYSPDQVTWPARQAGRFPPTVILMSRHGDVHAIGKARTLVRALRTAGVATELFLYPTGSHYWEGRQGRMGFARATAFLRRHL